MGKVKLPKKVADAIESIKTRIGDRGLYNYPSIALHAPNNKEYKIINDFITKSDENFKKYFHALLDGYELEPTPEEIVRRQYQQYLKTDKYVSANAYIELLTILDIKIEGVNA
jgi:hypothetical protein